MAGYSWKIAEKTLLVNIIKSAIETFKAKQSEAEKNGDTLTAYTSKQQAEMASDILNKIEGTVNAKG